MERPLCRLFLLRSSSPCLKRYEQGAIYCNLTNDFELKCLEIVLPAFPGFSAHHLPLVLLLHRDRSAELKSLTVSNIDAYDKVLSGFFLQFPRLEEFRISKSHCCSKSRAVQMILDNAPTLQRVSVQHPSMLEFFHEQKYALLKE